MVTRRVRPSFKASSNAPVTPAYPCLPATGEIHEASGGCGADWLTMPLLAKEAQGE
jgi:hypothetical protein